MAEAARRKTDEELKRVRAEASAAAELAVSQVAASKALATSAERALAAKNAEVRTSYISTTLTGDQPSLSVLPLTYAVLLQ